MKSSQADPEQGEKSKSAEFVREHLANQRTLLAWARTGIALMALGFVVARFGLLLRQLGSAALNPIPRATSTVFGTTLVVSGAVLMVLATITYLRTGRAIDARAFRWSPTLGLVLGAFVVFVALVLAIYLVVTG